MAMAQGAGEQQAAGRGLPRSAAVGEPLAIPGWGPRVWQLQGHFYRPHLFLPEEKERKPSPCRASKAGAGCLIAGRRRDTGKDFL